jgi:hypothetical protein
MKTKAYKTIREFGYALMGYEMGQLNTKEKIKLFQYLIDTEEVFKIPRKYLGEIVQFINEGKVKDLEG